MSKERVEAFSDGVLAVAITLLALDLHVPTSGHLAHELARQWPNYVAYVVSFLTIGIIWINHHAMFRRLTAVDHAVLTLNLVLLLMICVLPFTTALMARYLTASHGSNLAAAVYAGSFLGMSIAFFGLQWRVFTTRQHLLADHITPELRQAILRRNATGLLPYAVATAAAAITPYVTLAICAILAVFYALPGTTTDAV